MDLALKDKVAIVTGSGRGIGAAIATTLAEEGTRVCVNDLFEERAQETADKIMSAGGQAIVAPADVTNREQVDAMVQTVIDAWGTVDILVNNAGIPARLGDDASDAGRSQVGGGGFFPDEPEELWARVMDVITYGVLNCSQACLPHMLKQEYGKIVSIISDAGRVGEPRLATYSMAKGGVVAFSKALAKEMGRFKINVNCVSPGATVTPALADSPVAGGGAAPADDDRADDSRAQDRFQRLLRQYPIGRGLERIGQPQDIANTVAFLVSDRAEWITGQVLSVNGGYSMV